MMGVHGNGLTSLVWMNPTPRSTIIEFFFPDGFAHDYEYTTRALGMTHYGFWDSQYVLLSIFFFLPYIFCLPTSPVISPAHVFHSQNIQKVSRVMTFRSMEWL